MKTGMALKQHFKEQKQLWYKEKSKKALLSAVFQQFNKHKIKNTYKIQHIDRVIKIIILATRHNAMPTSSCRRRGEQGGKMAATLPESPCNAHTESDIRRGGYRISEYLP